MTPDCFMEIEALRLSFLSRISARRSSFTILFRVYGASHLSESPFMGSFCTRIIGLVVAADCLK